MSDAVAMCRRLPSTRRHRLAATLRVIGRVGCVSAALALTACGDRHDGSARIAAQQWNQMRVEIQTEPDPPRIGANEVLVILAAPRTVAAYDSLVWLRTSGDDPWVQAIQDGHTAVYRRVVRLDPPQRTTLQVRIDRQNDQTVLSFPMLAASN